MLDSYGSGILPSTAANNQASNLLPLGMWPHCLPKWRGWNLWFSRSTYFDYLQWDSPLQPYYKLYQKESWRNIMLSDSLSTGRCSFTSECIFRRMLLSFHMQKQSNQSDIVRYELKLAAQIFGAHADEAAIACSKSSFG